MSVPYVFGTATAAIPLSQLDSNFNTTITLGNTAIQLGNTVTTLNNMTLANVTVTSGTSNITSTTISNGTSNVTVASSGGNINLTTAGTERARIDSSGNLIVNGSSVVVQAYGLSTTANDSANRNVRTIIVTGDGGASTAQIYWNIYSGVPSGSVGATRGCLGAYDRSGNYYSNTDVLSNSGNFSIYGFKAA